MSQGNVVHGDAPLNDSDCFALSSHKRVLGIRLEPPADVDLDLIIRNEDFEQPVGQHPLAFRGAREFFITDPFVYQDQTIYVCVENLDQDAADVSYELTFVDFTPAYSPPLGAAD